MKFNITVRDVNGATLTPSFVDAIYAEQAPGNAGTTTVRRRLLPGHPLDAQPAVNRVSFTIAVDNFADENVTVGHSSGRWLTDNPACAVAVQGDVVDLTVTSGCVRFAPVTFIPNETLLKDNPRATLVDPEGGSGDWMYRGAWPNPETSFYRLSEPVFGDPDAKEWKRFNHAVSRVEPKNQGSLLFLEYGHPVGVGRRDPRFLIAAWVPRTALGTNPQVVVFFAPSTGMSEFYPPDSYPFLGEYPYGLSASAPAYTRIDPKKPIRADQVHQPYVALGVSYLLVGYKIIYQLLAAGRNPIVLMPISPFGSWGPFSAQSGQWRSIKEVVRFLYASRLASSRAAPFARFALNGGRASLFARDGLFTDEQVPDKPSITISAFSFGINAVVNLCTVEKFDEKLYSPALYSAAPATFLSEWHEIWDMDGADSNGWNHFVRTMQGWLSGAARRRVRSYHSEGTYRPGLVEPSQIVRKQGKAGFVEEGSSKDGRVTWVHASNSYLTGDRKDPDHQKVVPEFGVFDAHHFVPAIGFEHAALFDVP